MQMLLKVSYNTYQSMTLESATLQLQVHNVHFGISERSLSLSEDSLFRTLRFQDTININSVNNEPQKIQHKLLIVICAIRSSHIAQETL